jgi:hypothetical protein
VVGCPQSHTMECAGLMSKDVGSVVVSCWVQYGRVSGPSGRVSYDERRGRQTRSSGLPPPAATSSTPNRGSASAVAPLGGHTCERKRDTAVQVGTEVLPECVARVARGLLGLCRRSRCQLCRVPQQVQQEPQAPGSVKRFHDGLKLGQSRHCFPLEMPFTQDTMVRNALPTGKMRCD